MLCINDTPISCILIAKHIELFLPMIYWEPSVFAELMAESWMTIRSISDTKGTLSKMLWKERTIMIYMEIGKLYCQNCFKILKYDEQVACK